MRAGVLEGGQERAFLSILAVLVGVEICLTLHHFTLRWSAGSFVHMTDHRCGDVMLLAVAWALVEVGVLVGRAGKGA